MSNENVKKVTRLDACNCRGSVSAAVDVDININLIHLYRSI